MGTIMRILFSLLILVVCPTLLAAQIGQQVNDRPLVFRNATVIDLGSGLTKRSMTVVISGNRISALGKELKVPGNAEIIDASGKFLIPGLWDMHVHVFNNSHQAGTDNHKLYFPLLLANGVTGVRDLWTDEEDLKLVAKWKADTAAGLMLAPRIAPSSDIVDGVPTHLPNMAGVATPDEARQKVRELKASGAGFIKVYWRLKPDVYFAIADESKKLGMAFAGHVPFAVSAFDASDAGQKSIEHLTGLLETCSSKEEELRNAADLTPPQLTEQLWQSHDETKCRELFRRFAKNKTWQMPNLVLQRMLAFRREENFRRDMRLKYAPAHEAAEWVKAPPRPQIFTLEVRKMRLAKLLEIVASMHKMGVPILAGTDLGNPLIFAGFSVHDELELLVQAGLTPTESLRTATLNPAKYLGMEKELGTIEKGKLADLILLDANPLANITNTKKISAVVVNGHFLNRTALDKMLADAQAEASRN
jgi:imidazolonepropionase-like amidohydrolase